MQRSSFEVKAGPAGTKIKGFTSAILVLVKIEFKQAKIRQLQGLKKALTNA